MNPRKPRASRAPVAAPAEYVEGMKLYVDPTKLNPELHYEWVREEIFGQPDTGSRRDALRRGFRPVMHSELNMEAVHWPGAKETDDAIREAGAILCARPKHLDEAERRRHASETETQMKNTIQDLAQFRQAGDPRYIQAMPEEGVADLGTDRGRFADA